MRVMGCPEIIFSTAYLSQQELLRKVEKLTWNYDGLDLDLDLTSSFVPCLKKVLFFKQKVLFLKLFNIKYELETHI